MISVFSVDHVHNPVLGIYQSKINAVKMIHLIIHLTAITILAAYSAALICYLTIETVHLPFTNVQGLVDDGTYKMTTYTSTDLFTIKVINFKLIII